jgi:hypothetical protein
MAVGGSGTGGVGVRRYAAKVDKGQAPIVKELRQVPGCVVKDLSRMGDGWPDLAVGYRGTNFYLEVKGRGKKLTEAQRDWHAEWAGSVHIVHDADEALRVIGVIKEVSSV